MRFKTFLILTCSFALCLFSFAFALTGEEIIQRVDDNLTFDSGYFESTMTIHINDEVRTKKMKSYAQGRNKSFAEFTYPARDKGVKYLKIDDNMWMYLPSVEKIIKITGNMLRQSMMGSDFSYEDALESSKLEEKYDIALAGEENNAYVLDLTAKVKEVTYYKRKIWVDKKTMVPTKEELFALSGKKLKEMTMDEVQKFGSRYYPTKITMHNLLRRGSYTEMTTDKAQFDVSLPADIFTQRNLRK